MTIVLERWSKVLLGLNKLKRAYCDQSNILLYLIQEDLNVTTNDISENNPCYPNCQVKIISGLENLKKLISCKVSEQQYNNKEFETHIKNRLPTVMLSDMEADDLQALIITLSLYKLLEKKSI